MTSLLQPVGSDKCFVFYVLLMIMIRNEEIKPTVSGFHDIRCSRDLCVEIPYYQLSPKRIDMESRDKNLYVPLSKV